MESNYFFSRNPNILKNSQLREPQIDAYIELYNHFIRDKKTTDAIVVLPTGSGKTGLMALAPFFISRGKVLIITPQLTILDTVVGALDTSNGQNFWTSRSVISNVNDLPKVAVYRKTGNNNNGLIEADIVIANIQKMQAVHDNSLINKYPSDYFDMILIDEAHHAQAQSWIDVIDHFNNSKVIKITATPYRTDKQPLTGELVYKYKLSQAMNKGYVKSLEKFNYIPEELFLTIDGNTETMYTVEEIKEMGYDDDWISRSVAFSDDCKAKVIERSLHVLSKKRERTDVPHKIIAAAPNVSEAKKIANMYNQHEGIRAVAVHNELQQHERDRIFLEIENDRIDVVVNVSMMGEGYDHKYLSVAAIFRVFKNILPYEQFIGRILRSIPENEIRKPDDNIGSVVVHEKLNLDDLWSYYKEQLQEYEFIKELDDVLEDGSEFEDRNSNSTTDNIIHKDFGYAGEIGEGTLSQEVYMSTEYVRERERYEKERLEKIEKLAEVLPTMSQDALENIIDSQESSDMLLNRPDLVILYKQQSTDAYIRQEIVPELLEKNSYDRNGFEISELPIFNFRNNWILKRAKNNAALLAIYFNDFLKSQIGYSRDSWTASDFEKAAGLLESQKSYIDDLMKG